MTFNIGYGAAWPDKDVPDYDDPRLVGQADRTWMIPLIHSTLANPNGLHQWPRYDKSTSLVDACAYWEGAYYLLGVLLGWSDIGRGLQRLYNGQRSGVESPELDLLEQVWNDRDQLDFFALWSWSNGVVVGGETSTSGRTPESFRDRRWLDQSLGRHLGNGIPYDHDPFHGGTNPLHLGHCLGAFQGVASGDLHLSSPKERRATLVLDRAQGWCAALEGLTLPSLGHRSWHVEVIIRPLGWLGTFRRSRETGRWFTGRHSVHTLGIG